MTSCLVLVSITAISSVGFAQPAGTFTASRSMTTPRAYHTATLLTNSKVLIAGGGPSASASAEIYDPSTGAFTGTGNMTTGRAHHTATLLPDGRVVIVGGCSNDLSVDVCAPPFLSSAELYDPVTETFSSTGNMMCPRNEGFTATLLANGKVLIAGGTSDFAGDSLVVAELYDPSTGTFTSTGNMSRRRTDHTATLLASGKFLVAGGIDQGLDTLVGVAELYDPETGTFTPTGGTPEGSGSVQRASLLPDGTVFGLIHEGTVSSAGDSAVRYAPSTASFSAAGDRPTLFTPVTTLLSDGTVLLTGRIDPGILVLPVSGHSADLYDPLSRGFSVPGDLNTPRWGHTATLLPDGTVLVCGGAYVAVPTVTPLASAEIYRSGVSKPAPVLYSLSGSAQGAILHAGTRQVVSPDAPAIAGDVLEIYCAGLLDGSVVPPQVSIGGRLAEVAWFGNAPGYPGLNQIDVRVPASIAPGAAVPVHLTYFERPSNQVTIGVGQP
ncbi:MAG TPA: kelch repeat-containing protein [Bryobacteraceae bacterium]|nr:kelch repeat-containing protein [Bryobacteraceae bacterium]